MTDDRMALAELLQKSGDGDFLRSVAEAVLQILMEADVEGLIPDPAVWRSLPALRGGFSTQDGDVRPAVGPAAAAVFSLEGTFAELG